MYIVQPRLICFMFERQLVCRAFSRAWAKTGKRIAASIAMIAMTTRSSISVNPRRCEGSGWTMGNTLLAVLFPLRPGRSSFSRIKFSLLRGYRKLPGVQRPDRFVVERRGNRAAQQRVVSLLHPGAKLPAEVG